jgi:hypothetical protein
MMIFPLIRIQKINQHPINSNNKIMNKLGDKELIVSTNMHLDKEFQ